VKIFRAKKVPIILALGNEESFYCKHYSKVAGKEELRKKFVDSLMDIINTYDLNGFLIQWQYPVFWNVSSDNQYNRFGNAQMLQTNVSQLFDLLKFHKILERYDARSQRRF